MKRFATVILAFLGLSLCANLAHAGWGTLGYGGYHKWPFNKKQGCSPEEKRWQKFWHDYYDSLEKYYDRLDNLDWVAYYKYHGYQLNAGQCMPMGNMCMPGCGPKVQPQYAPVFVAPSMQWAVPGNCAPCVGPGH